MKNVVVFGFGNIGQVLIQKLKKKNVKVVAVVRSSGIFDADLNKIADSKDWPNFIDQVDGAFICIPGNGRGEEAFEYEMAFLKKGKPVITCEKASIAHHFEKLKPHQNIFKYTASVGGGTQMLKELKKVSDILAIKAVVNGTLNYISDSLKNGKSESEIVKEVLAKGFAEPGAKNFDEIIKGEMNDVFLKTVILANHSGMFEHTITEKEVEILDFDPNKRCIVEIAKNQSGENIIRAGFIEDNRADWLPTGVNNTLYINGTEKVTGPGAGAEVTVSSMLSDFDSIKG